MDGGGKIIERTLLIALVPDLRVRKAPLLSNGRSPSLERVPEFRRPWPAHPRSRRNRQLRKDHGTERSPDLEHAPRRHRQRPPRSSSTPCRRHKRSPDLEGPPLSLVSSPCSAAVAPRVERERSPKIEPRATRRDRAHHAVDHPAPRRRERSPVLEGQGVGLAARRAGPACSADHPPRPPHLRALGAAAGAPGG